MPMRAAADLSNLQPQQVLTSRGPVEIVDAGSGPVLLCLHGGMGGCDHAALLADILFADLSGYRVIAVSRPGYLGTPVIDPAGPDANADLLASLLDSLQIDRAMVAGVSAGGPTALAFAERFPGRCTGLILASACTGHLETPDAMRKRLPMVRLMARMPWLLAFMRWRRARNPQRAVRRAIADGTVADRTLADPQSGPLLLALQDSTFRQFSARFAGTVQDMEVFEALGQWPFGTIGVPSLIIHGTEDRIVPFAHAATAARHLEHSRLLAVEGGEHLCIFSHMAMVRDAVQAFCQDRAFLPLPSME